MTYVEFFEKDDIENICASLAKPPERVILIGDKTKQMKKHAARYAAVLAGRGHQVEFVCREVSKHRLEKIVEELEHIIATEKDCVFDLTGGEDLYLVAMGMVCERHKEKKLQMHRFNLRSDAVIDCDADGETLFEHAAPALTVEENVAIYGGDVVYDDVKHDATHRWEWTEEFREDIDAMWELCRKDPHLWNNQVGVLAAAASRGGRSEDGLTATARLETLDAWKDQYNGYFIEQLHRAGLLTAFYHDEQTLSVTFKNHQIRHCLTKSGQALEMKVWSAARQSREKDGTPTYQDARNGVFIDWDGEIHAPGKGYDTENEIDVLLMHGLVPVFVSCKNGKVEMEELYKLDTVARRFGGKYAKKVLVATALGHGPAAEYVRQRARDMDIRMVEDVQAKSEEELERVIRSFWRG